MAFLEKEELRTVATMEIVNLITNNNDTIVTEVIDESIDVMSGYLFQYFDTDVIFSRTGDDRNKTVLKHLKNIVMFEVSIRRKCPISKYIEDGKNEALLWLEKVSEGKIKPPLPIRMTDSNGDGTPDTPATFMKTGSNKKYSNHW
ncbi:phage protein Gp36 family protein [Flavobacterium sp. DG1-102-2]|nr:phage protein Gp36 family protein [Flavobacterium sp. DG1-102-2]MDV6170222.1 phage protein Gp36 family protein [Flavobacterium sp. DG1-102-2]